MYQRQVTFKEAVVKALTENYCNFSGRSSRSEYWWFSLFGFIVGWAIGLIFSRSQATMEIVSGAVTLILLLPSLGLSVRRLHDIGKSGWWILLGLIPVIGQIIIIVWACRESNMYPNQYGPVPNLVE